MVWIDADARLMSDPTDYFEKLAAESIDFAAYFIPNSLMRKQHIPGSDPNNDGIASGTMFFNFSPGTPFSLSVPFDCGLIGAAGSAQGGSVAPGPTIALTNALDLVFGSP